MKTLLPPATAKKARAARSRPRMVQRPVAAYASEGATVAPVKQPLMPSLAALLTGHILRDGEVVLLILKPSLWFIFFSVMRFAAVVLMLLIGIKLWHHDRFTHLYIASCVFVLAGRVMWALLQWMSRLYVLTDCRVLRLGGIFTIDILDCPLRKVATTRISYSFRERLWGLGSIEITPMNEAIVPWMWQTIRRPIHVHEQIVAAINKAKSGGTLCARD